MNDSIFSPRLLVAWIAAAVIVFAITLYFMGGGEFTSPEGYNPSTYSRSAIGHAGIAEVLQRLNIPTIKSRSDTLEKARGGGIVVIAEPDLGSKNEETIRTLLRANTVLLVLPKRRGLPNEKHTGWIRQVENVSTVTAQSTLRIVASSGEVLRLNGTETWTKNALGITPNIVTPVQLMRGDQMTPIIGTADAMLIGEITDRNRKIWILSDPDIISNHGLALAGNAELFVAMIERLRRGNGVVVFDETIHGYPARADNPFLLMFRFPFVIATAQAAIAVALLLWATIARFGAPQAAPLALSVGRLGLLQNIAKLIEFTGHQQVIVRRYVQETIRDVARQLHAPASLVGAPLVAWLQRVGSARSVSVDCGEVARRASELGEGRRDGTGYVQIARDIYLWKREIIDGRSGNPRAH
jgi:hypothetical protein